MQKPTPTTAAGQRLRRLARQAALLIFVPLPLPLLIGCGGGDRGPQPDKTIDPVLCMHRPELCR